MLTNYEVQRVSEPDTESSLIAVRDLRAPSDIWYAVDLEPPRFVCNLVVGSGLDMLATDEVLETELLPQLRLHATSDHPLRDWTFEALRKIVDLRYQIGRLDLRESALRERRRRLQEELDVLTCLPGLE